MSAPGAGAPAGVTLLLLNGGGSRRMGRDKASMEVDGRPLGMRPVEALGPLVVEVVVAGRPVPGLAARTVADGVPGAGPLAGVVAGLGGVRTPLAVAVACDMPALVPAVVELLLARLAAGPGLLAACCAGPAGLEPLPLALRAAAARAPLEAALARGERALRAALEGPGLGVVEEADWRALDPEGRCFLNWNRPEEVAGVVH
ncbi:MAG TPA: NTP transferase domain-containing protein [Candidatus Dormibacteraeota bacterium]|jgi:molybdopterin-guanine dinucleotide biosynthesis protein A|nr:NTP transferase domain-containing protein [Candidatus Dormibacteraeota bacterium]